MIIPLLEVVIPTYKRSSFACRAIESCLAIESEDLVVSCNSNGPDPLLESFSKEPSCSRLRYSSFDKNLGFNANFSFLAKKVRAKYFMLLSDEDHLDSRYAQSYLAFLKSLDEKVAVISSSIYDSQNHDYYSCPRVLHGKLLDINQYLCCSEPIPTYISGLVFKSDQVSDELVDQCTVIADGANSYPNLDLILALLDRGHLASFCSYMFVIKGGEAKVGGDSHSHKISSFHDNTGQLVVRSESNQNKNLDLNPRVYGPEARTRQFVYRLTRIIRLKRASQLAKCIGIIHVFIFFAVAVLRSPSVVRLPENFKLSNAVRHGIRGLPLSADCPMIWLQAFVFVIVFSRSLGRVFIKCLGLILVLSRNVTLKFSVR